MARHGLKHKSRLPELLSPLSHQPQELVSEQSYRSHSSNLRSAEVLPCQTLSKSLLALYISGHWQYDTENPFTASLRDLSEYIHYYVCKFLTESKKKEFHSAATATCAISYSLQTD